MLFDKSEQVRLKEWGRTQGFTSLAKLIEAALDAVQRNPSLLQPTEDNSSVKILESLKGLQIGGLTNEIKEVLEQHTNKIKNLDKKIDWLLQKQGATKKDIKLIVKNDLGHDAVFD